MSAPIVLVKKKDSTIRFCVVYRRLNAAPTIDAYSLPRTEEVREDTILLNHRFSGYWQIPVADKGHPQTALTIPIGLFQFK